MTTPWLIHKNAQHKVKIERKISKPLITNTKLTTNFVDIQHRYSSILIVFRGAGLAHNNWLAQYEYTEFYETKKTLTRTNVLRVH